MSTITRPHAEIARSTAATNDRPAREVPQLRCMRNEYPAPGSIIRTIRASHTPPSAGTHLPPARHPPGAREAAPPGRHHARAVTQGSPAASSREKDDDRNPRDPAHQASKIPGAIHWSLIWGCWSHWRQAV